MVPRRRGSRAARGRRWFLFGSSRSAAGVVLGPCSRAAGCRRGKSRTTTGLTRRSGRSRALLVHRPSSPRKAAGKARARLGPQVIRGVDMTSGVKRAPAVLVFSTLMQPPGNLGLAGLAGLANMRETSTRFCRGLAAAPQNSPPREKTTRQDAAGATISRVGDLQHPLYPGEAPFLGEVRCSFVFSLGSRRVLFRAAAHEMSAVEVSESLTETAGQRRSQ